MISVIKQGDIFSSKLQTLVNPVNCEGVMGAGLALEFKKRYPKMFELYQYECSLGMIVPGVLKAYPQGDHVVLNFPTKNKWSQPSKLTYIEVGLMNMQHLNGLTSMALPALGCGLGGLFVNDVLHLVYQYLEPLNIPIEFYT